MAPDPATPDFRPLSPNSHLFFPDLRMSEHWELSRRLFAIFSPCGQAKESITTRPTTRSQGNPFAP